MSFPHLNAIPDDAPDFVVHNYSSSALTPPSSLLESAYGLIRVATLPSAWLNVQNVTPVVASRVSANSVQYPSIDIQIHTKSEDESAKLCKAWGAPLTDDEDIFTLNDLEDFSSTNFAFLVDLRRVSQAPNSIPTPLEPPSRPQYRLDLNSLYSVISQPHVHPSSAVTPQRPFKLVPYLKTRPIPIPPYTSPFSPSPYTRSAWLIPVRGHFSWDRCTPAIILDSSHEVPARPDSKNHIPIAWTHSCLRSFWTFLLHVREKRTAGMIGLSFHASRNDAQTSHVLNTTSSVLPEPGNQQTLEPHLTSDTGTIATAVSAHRVVLSNVDHIKVYHEASNAMHLRNLFHLWSYVAPSGAEAHPHEKIRILKGARLVLVDERSRGILIS